jgi:hypothetical protein
MLQQHSQKLWPCVTSDPCVPTLSHLSLRLQRSASNWPTSEPADGTSSEWLPSMYTGPAGLLPPASTSAPPEVGYVWVCVGPLQWVSVPVWHPILSLCYSQGLGTGGTILYNMICLSNGPLTHFVTHVHVQIVFSAYCVGVSVTFWLELNQACTEENPVCRNIHAYIHYRLFTPAMLIYCKQIAKWFWQDVLKIYHKHM